MRQTIIRLILLGVLCTPSNIFSQTKNSISLQTGLFHYFFDRSPILNINYPEKYNNRDIFNGLILNSNGIEFTRDLNVKSSVLINFFSFRQSYSIYYKTAIPNPVVGHRYFSTIGINYLRKINLKEKVTFHYGGGLNFRSGDEGVIVAQIPLGEFNGEAVYELLIENIRRNDFGLNSFCGLSYSPVNRISLFSKIDLLGIIYIDDKNQKEDMINVYNSPQFPSRFDMSIKFGIGFHF